MMYDNVERLYQNCLMDAHGDYKKALRLACETADFYFQNTSAGLIQERRFNPLPRAIPPKEPLKGGPVLIEGEPT